MIIDILQPTNPDLPSSARRLFIDIDNYSVRDCLPVFQCALFKIVTTPGVVTKADPEPADIKTDVTVKSGMECALKQEQWDAWGVQATADYVPGCILENLGLTKS